MIPLSLLIWLSVQSPSLIPRTLPPVYLLLSPSLTHAQQHKNKIKSTFFSPHHESAQNKGLGWTLAKGYYCFSLSAPDRMHGFCATLAFDKKKGGEGRQSSRDREIKKRRLIDRERGGQY